jgi:hypothetical protein
MLYHGTSEARWNAIVTAGAILPRQSHGVSNWGHSCPSHPHAVYLTDVYPGYFALSAIGEDEFDKAEIRLAIIEVDPAKILSGLTADEDALEQSSRTAPVSRKQMHRRTAIARGKLAGLVGTDAWERSIAYMGTCAHLGPIPLSAVTRVAFVGMRENAQWAFANMQPSIRHLNYKYCGSDYAVLTEQAFDIGEVLEFNAADWEVQP